MVYFELAQQHILRVFVRNIPHHDWRSAVLLDAWYIYLEGVGLLCADGSSVSDWCLDVVVVVCLRYVVYGDIGAGVTLTDCVINSFCFSVVARGVARRDRIWTVLSFFGDDFDAWLHDVCDHIVIFFWTFRGLTLILFDLFHWQFLVILVL